jgi:hypothetical protein
MPFDRSREERARLLSEDAIEIPDVLFTQLVRISERYR